MSKSILQQILTTPKVVKIQLKDKFLLKVLWLKVLGEYIENVL